MFSIDHAKLMLIFPAFVFQPPPGQGVGGSMIVLAFFALPAIAIGIWAGRAIAARLRDDQRKMYGGLLLLIGIVLVIYGSSSVSSVGEMTYGAGQGPWFSRVTRSSEGVIGIATICFGELVAAVGLVILIAKGSKRGMAQMSSTKTCPFCAETIKSEAKICRYCGKSLEDATDN